MIEGIFISASGMLPKVSRHEVLANNIANAEVPGFKRDNLFFREVKEAMKRQSGDYPDWRINRLEGNWIDVAQGTLRRTGDMFNVAISGRGFFAVQTPEGIQYTRNGNFSRDNEGRLVDQLGNPVLSTDGEPIVVPNNFRTPVIDAAGTVKGRDELLGIDQTIAQLQVTDFPELYDPQVRAESPYSSPLKKSRDGFFIPRPGTPQVPAGDFELSQGFLEKSNVNPVLEMVEMIEVSRGYEADQRAIRIQDSTLDRAVNDVGVVR